MSSNVGASAILPSSPTESPSTSPRSTSFAEAMYHVFGTTAAAAPAMAATRITQRSVLFILFSQSLTDARSLPRPGEPVDRDGNLSFADDVEIGGLFVLDERIPEDRPYLSRGHGVTQRLERGMR